MSRHGNEDVGPRLSPTSQAEARSDDFNLLVSIVPGTPGRARREVVTRLRKLADVAPEVVRTAARGILGVRTALDPREVVQQLRRLCERAPGTFRYTLRWVPVDRWARADMDAMEEAIVHLKTRIGPNETWRMTVERRSQTTLDANQVIRSLAELIDARVNLSHPDKVVLVQLFGDQVAFSVVAPGEVFSVVKVLAARPPEILASSASQGEEPWPRQ